MCCVFINISNYYTISQQFGLYEMNVFFFIVISIDAAVSLSRHQN